MFVKSCWSSKVLHFGNFHTICLLIVVDFESGFADFFWSARPAQSASILTPQVTIVNGRIVINQQSLVVGAQASTREDTNTYQRVEEDRPKLNYNSYSNRTPVERWKQEDTDLFYKV